MAKHTAIFFCLLLLTALAMAQSSAGKTEKPAAVSANGIEVLFATNDDCNLFINNDPKGALSKSSFLYVKLAPGSYLYRVKSKATGDELSEAFTVAENATNEVFADLLYTVDVKTEERARVAAAATPANTTSPSIQATAAVNRISEKKTPINNKEAQAETINILVSNAVLIKGGSFVMGNNRARVTDETEHPVTLNAFYFSKYEVTQYQWETLMGYNPSVNKNCPTCPVENVSWEEAMLFIRKLNAISEQKFRLPTEAEWECVARMGGKAEVEKAGGQEAYIKKTAWYFSNAESREHPVGRREPNEAGIYDLTGNVSEWCYDWYSTGFYKEELNQKNPEGPSLGKEKVIRGGNFKDYIGDRFRPSFRNKRIPTAKSNEVGFRLVMERKN